MKILVTGGAGFIGSHVADAYLAAGHDTIVVDDLSTGRYDLINPGAKFYRLDIRSPELREIFEKEQPDIVNHHAAQVDVRRSVSEPVFDAEVNIIGSLNLLENSIKTGVKKVVYSSTGGAVYGEPAYLPCDENHPIRPICQYGASKYIVEQYLQMYHHNYGIDYTVLRYPNVYGPRQNPHGEAGVVAIFASRMLENRRIFINGDGEQQRDFVYVADCVNANMLATSGDINGIYNLGSGQGTTVNEIFRYLKEITGYDQPVVHAPEKVGETRIIYLNSQRAQRDLAWEPAQGLREGLEETVRYFRDSN